MASTSRGKKSRGAGKRAASGAKKRTSAKSSKSTSRAARAGTKKRPAARAASARSAKPAASTAAVTALKAKFEREKGALEKRLTETVREIGQLRIHESRVTLLERQLKERDETIAQLRSQLNDLRDRSAALVEDPEVQPSLALGERTPRDLDDFDDVAIDDDDDLV